MITVKDVTISDGSVKTVSLLHKTDSYRGGILVCAFYKDNKLTEVVPTPILYSEEENPQTIEVNKAVPQEADYVRVFIFKDWNSILPLSYAKKYPVNN